MHSVTYDALSWWTYRKTVHPRLCVVLLPPRLPAKDYFRQQDRFYVKKKGADLKVQNYCFILRC